MFSDTNSNNINSYLNNLQIFLNQIQSDTIINSKDFLTLTRELLYLNSESAMTKPLVYCFEQLTTLLLVKSSSVEQYTQILETLLYLFIFHYSHAYNYLGLMILKHFLSTYEFEFHKDLLVTFLKTTQLLKAKQSSSPLICSRMLQNLSLGISLIVRNTNSETRKYFFDFLKQNCEDHITLFILCNNLTSEYNTAKFFSNEQQLELFTKFSSELEKQTKNFEVLIHKNDKSLTMKNKIKQTFDIVNCICTVLDCFTVKGNRGYNLDKMVKGVGSVLKKFWNSIFFNVDILDVDFAVDSISNVISYTTCGNTIGMDYLLPLLNWNALLLDRNGKYVANTKLIVDLLCLSGCVPEEAKREIGFIIVEKIEVVLGKGGNELAEKFYIEEIFRSLQKMMGHMSLEIDQQFPEALAFYCKMNLPMPMEEEVNNYSLQNEQLYMKGYKDVLTVSDKGNSTVKEEKRNLLKCSLKKFEDFKNSLKSVYELEKYNLLVDNKISNFYEKDNLKLEDWEEFYLQTSIDMFTEIFKPK